MRRWIVEGIRHGGGGWDTRVVIIEASSKAKALSDITRSGRLRGYELSARLAMPEDNPQDLEQALDVAMRDASVELDRLVTETAAELAQDASPPGRRPGPR